MVGPITRITRTLVDRIQQEYPDIEILDLSENEIDRVENLQGFRKVRELDISSNRLKIVDFRSYIDIPSLEILNLSNNQISTVIGAHEVAPIRYVDLSRNPIQDFNVLYEFQCLRASLVDLTLRGTPLSTHQNYREQVYTILPWLYSLDGTPFSTKPRLPSEAESSNLGGCVSSASQPVKIEQSVQTITPPAIATHSIATSATSSMHTEGSQTAISTQTIHSQTSKAVTTTLGVQTDMMEQKSDTHSNNSDLANDNQKLLEQIAAYQESLTKLQKQCDVLESEKVALVKDKQNLSKMLARRDQETISRVEAIEQLLVAQERVITDTSNNKQPAHGDVGRKLLEAWRKKVYAVMVQQKSAELAHQRSLVDLQVECNRLRMELSSIQTEDSENLVQTRNALQRQRELNHDLVKAEKRIVQLEHERNFCRDALEQVATMHKKEIFGVERLMEKLSRYADRMDTLGMKCENLGQLMHQKNLHATAMRQKLLASEKRANENDRKCFQLSLKLDDCETRGNFHLDNVGLLKSRIAELEETIHAFTTETKAQTDSRIREAVLQANSRYEVLLDEHNAAKRECSKLEAQVHSLENQIEEQELRFSKLENSKVCYLEEKLKFREDELAATRKERNTLLGTLRDAERHGRLSGHGLTRSSPPDAKVIPRPQSADESDAETEHTNQDRDDESVEMSTDDLELETKTGVTRESVADLAVRLLEEEEDALLLSSDDDDDVLEQMLERAARSAISHR